ncbi:hypothetical protein ADUPG1_011728 [Aduncisulcus paluster]|uniref:Uncharacterized protein n=1 Tax=Aduncisulcus paluster TaxID=2918883 RepID=A0ABQ5JWV8_9EUKA|nr:hypothetical protein ADUPG1_011728 [Aduncisulcus paluster]
MLTHAQTYLKLGKEVYGDPEKLESAKAILAERTTAFVKSQQHIMLLSDNGKIDLASDDVATRLGEAEERRKKAEKYLDEKKFKEAIDQLDVAIKLDPTNVFLRGDRALARLGQEKWESMEPAVLDAIQAVRLEPTSHEQHKLLQTVLNGMWILYDKRKLEGKSVEIDNDEIKRMFSRYVEAKEKELKESKGEPVDVKCLKITKEEGEKK